MPDKLNAVVARHDHDRTRLLDMLLEVQGLEGHVSPTVIEGLASALNLSPQDVAETASFYHFLQTRPFGEHAIYLCDSVIARMNGHGEVRDALQEATGTTFGTAIEVFGLDDTACIGLSDQEPAMMVDDVVFTRLTPARVREIIEALQSGASPGSIANPDGHAKDSRAYVDAQVETNIRKAGPVFFDANVDHKAILSACVDMEPGDIIARLIASDIRGRGGAGFPVGQKWQFAREARGGQKYIICNADEGEPGAFKDRVLLTQSPRDVFSGMVIAGLGVGATSGIVYLRAEYAYLKEYLERELEQMRLEGLLGPRVLGSNAPFEIRLQMGAGSYVCGDDTALIESCEGKRGTPRIKPPFPAQSGYLGMPTVVNNVETLAAVTRIMERGAAWYATMGTEASSGTLLLSVSGDCARPGVYEIAWGITLAEMLEMVGARNPHAVQVSGPSGQCVSAAQDGTRRFCRSDLPCNGSVMVFDQSRDLLAIARHFTQFFVDESCGICTPCRAGGVALLDGIDRVISGTASAEDLGAFKAWGKMMQETSRCGLGKTAARPILTTMDRFPTTYAQRIAKPTSVVKPGVDRSAAVSAHDEIARALEEENRT